MNFHPYSQFNTKYVLPPLSGNPNFYLQPSPPSDIYFRPPLPPYFRPLQNPPPPSRNQTHQPQFIYLNPRRPIYDQSRSTQNYNNNTPGLHNRLNDARNQFEFPCDTPKVHPGNNLICRGYQETDRVRPVLDFRKGIDSNPVEGGQYFPNHNSSSRAYEFCDRKLDCESGPNCNGKYSIRVDKESCGELIRVPKKKQQKSVLSRLNDPRTRKEPSPDSFDHKEEDVELDISFRSNVLVAKAITTPSRLEVVSNSNNTRKNKKSKKVEARSSNSICLTKTKHDRLSVNPDGISDITANPLTLNKETCQSDNKVEVIGAQTIFDINSPSHSTKTIVPLVKGSENVVSHSLGADETFSCIKSTNIVEEGNTFSNFGNLDVVCTDEATTFNGNNSLSMLQDVPKSISQLNDDVVPSTGTLDTTALSPLEKGIESCFIGGLFDAMDAAGNEFEHDLLKFTGQSIDSHAVQESVLNIQPPFSSTLICEQKEISMTVASTTYHQDDLMHVENENKHDMLAADSGQNRICFELAAVDLNQIRSISAMDYDSLVLKEDNFPSTLDPLPLCADHNESSSIYPDCEIVQNEPMEVAQNEVYETCSLKSPSLDPCLQILNDSKLDEIVADANSRSPVSNSPSRNSRSFHATRSGHLISVDGAQLPSECLNVNTEALKSLNIDSIGEKNQLSTGFPTIIPGRSPFISSKKAVSSKNVVRPRTWHRISNPIMSPLLGKKLYGDVALATQLQENIGTIRNSTTYVRKGNSLVRKESPESILPKSYHGLNSSVFRLNPLSINEMTNAGSELSDPSKRPKTPPSQHSNGNSNCITMPLVDHLSSPPENFILDDCSENILHSKHTEMEDAQKSAEDGNFPSVQMKNMVYLKRKSNQLVATSDPCDLSIDSADKSGALSSDGYYKKKKNQLIRTSENDTGIPETVPGTNSNSKQQRALEVISSRSHTRKRSDRLLSKKCKPSNFSSVWTLGDTQSSKRDAFSSRCKKMLPNLFPWKRTTYWKRSMQNLASCSLSTVGKKLLMLRKKDAVYTRSSHGLSLRKSKVLGIGGSNLKWSKSIERRSKKANEDATLAVAEVEKKKRQESNVGFVTSRTKSNFPRERIFRIGLVRYKMDRSRRTLQRIADIDDVGSSPRSIQSEKSLKKSYVPKRLLIGNDEYIRIGNGNQLVRDPKKRIRILANEKVRWSLHAARMRLARKRKYCQFYTRFGKCNKHSGKCPYIHDPSKIAVCTKFLNSLCSDPNCKLTHKVIPERMQDCSYFLQGLCSNENCSYRHVRVNPKASICEGFLKGFCEDGDECRKKHSYVCLDFESGTCSEGSKCKLHHPKKMSVGKKRKKPEEINPMCRYFDSVQMNNDVPKMVASENHNSPDHGSDDIFFKNGKFTNYISFDDSEEEAEET